MALTPILVYPSTVRQREYFNERLKEEFGSASRGIISILTERYGSWICPGRDRGAIEIKGYKE